MSLTLIQHLMILEQICILIRCATKECSAIIHFRPCRCRKDARDFHRDIFLRDLIVPDRPRTLSRFSTNFEGDDSLLEMWTECELEKDRRILHVPGGHRTMTRCATKLAGREECLDHTVIVLVARPDCHDVSDMDGTSAQAWRLQTNAVEIRKANIHA